MNQKRNGRLTGNAQNLRNRMTKEERCLWYECLKQLPITINRQKVIGNYIVDFYCAVANLVIELDGSQHYQEDAQEADRIRDAYLQSLGLTVLRYTNRDVNRYFREVCEDIYRHIPQLSTSSVAAATASPQGEAKVRPLQKPSP